MLDQEGKISNICKKDCSVFDFTHLKEVRSVRNKRFGNFWLYTVNFRKEAQE